MGVNRRQLMVVGAHSALYGSPYGGVLGEALPASPARPKNTGRRGRWIW